MTERGQDIAENRQYSPADMLDWFGVPRTSLYRWEDEGKITRPQRDSKGQRIYNTANAAQVAGVVRESIAAEISLMARFDPEIPLPTPSQLERLYLCKVVTDPQQGLRHLTYFAERGFPLSEMTSRLLVQEALERRPGDPVRRKVWDVFIAQDSSPSIVQSVNLS